MSWRQPTVVASSAITIKLVRNPGYLPRFQSLEETRRGLSIKQRVRRLDAKEKPVARSVDEALDIENRMVRHRQSVESQHPQHRHERSNQNCHLEGDWNK